MLDHYVRWVRYRSATGTSFHHARWRRSVGNVEKKDGDELIDCKAGRMLPGEIISARRGMFMLRGKISSVLKEIFDVQSKLTTAALACGLMFGVGGAAHATYTDQSVNDANWSTIWSD